MIVQKPQFDPSFFKIGQAITICPGSNNGEYQMGCYFEELNPSNRKTVAALVKAVRPFELDVVFINLRDVDKVTLKVNDLVEEKIVIHLMTKEGSSA
jgi:hypothetical protein